MIQPQPSPPLPEIIFITGNMASGKSSVAQAVAERLTKSVHLRGDVFRRMIVNGQAAMTFKLSAEAHHQLQLRYTLAVETAKRYVDAGFTVVYQDIVIGSALAQVIAALGSYQLGVVVLCPRPEVIAVRDQARGKTGYPNRASVDAFDQILRTETPPIGYWLDNSNLTLLETVDTIFSHLAQAVIHINSGAES